MNDLKRRKGSIKISREFIEGNPERELLSALFSVFYPLFIEHKYSPSFYHEIVYHGVSPCFEPIEEGCVAPQYEFQFTKIGGAYVISKCYKV